MTRMEFSLRFSGALGRLLGLGACALWLCACAAPSATQGPAADLIREGRYDEAIEHLEKAVAAHPQDSSLRRNLGIARLKNGEPEAAASHLALARKIRGKDDAATLFFLGEAEEGGRQYARAAEAYEAYLKLKPKDASVRTRLREVRQKQFRSEIEKAIQQEGRTSTADIPENTVAVMEFRNLSASAELAPLSKGLQAMLTGDLAKVKRFTVVERAKLPILLEEIKLGLSTVEVRPEGAKSPVTTTKGVKERLASMKRKDGSGRSYYEGPIDDTMDAVFEEAVRSFQKDVGIGVDGKVGPQTRFAVTDAYNAWLASATISVPAMDKSSVPRVGKILGARKLVQGNFSGDVEKSFSIDAGMTESATGQTTAGGDAGGRLKDLFRMEKEVVYELLKAMDVKLTGEEKDAIGRVPTRNLDAFLAWSQGLGYEDRGLLVEARQSYGRAVQLDPGFSLAREQLDAVSGTTEEFSRTESRLTGQALSAGAETGAGGGDFVLARLDVVGAINGRGLAPARNGDDQLNPTVAPIAAAGGTGTVIITGEVPR